jgi:hypothetical protein
LLASASGWRNILDDALKLKLKQSFWKGKLKVRALPSGGEGAPVLLPVKDVMRHHTAHKPTFLIRTLLGQEVVCTGDHSLFRWEGDTPAPFPASEVQVGLTELVSRNAQGELERALVAFVQELPPEEHTFDLCVPGAENFFLDNGLLAHNSYSIGGISLDINKSSQYESLKGNAESQLDKLTEFKTRTEKYTFGLQQSRYGVGVRSAFGPATGRSTITPRKYLGF